MAVWQFVIDLIPASSARVAGVTAARMSRDQLDEINLGFSNADAEVLLARIGKLLPEKNLGLLIYGFGVTRKPTTFRLALTSIGLRMSSSA